MIDMDIIRGARGVPYEKTVVALGNFDGLHTAHMKIIETCRRAAEKRGIKSGALLFEEHSSNTIKNKRVKVITSETQKLEILSRAGLDFAYICSFDRDFMRMSPEKFARWLKDMLHVMSVCVGYDYRFGFKAAGDTVLLGELGDKHGFDVIVTDEIDYGGVAVKSTAIRHLITDGYMNTAALMLGRPFSIEGTVERGLRNGSEMGFPTANIGYGEDVLLPCCGVYAGYTYVGDKKYKSVINVGNNPTFGAEKVTIESYILGFKGDIYGQTVKVEFIKRLRGDKRFDSVDALKEQINKDIENAGKELM